jgi:SDR family mycofactocin-dependent oxidoreductase
VTRLADKVAFVTGAARGQGRSHVVRLAEEGAHIIATDLRGPDEDAEFAETVAAVEATGRRILADAADVRDQSQLENVLARGVEAFGRVDIAVANAGVVFVEPTLQVSEEHWQLMLDVNVGGAFHTARAVIPHMIDAGGGAIVITGSTMAHKATPAIAGYASSKHAIIGLMKVLALEFASHNIRVNSVHPTTVNTPMLDGIMPGGLGNEELKEHYRTSVNALSVPWVEPVDVSNAIVFLVSDEARYITGAALPVDAGALLMSGSKG